MAFIGRASILFACLLVCHSNRIKIRNGIECLTVNCTYNQNFTPCTVSGEKDKCKDCDPGLLMLDKIDTYLFEKIDCEPSGCTECDHRDSVLDNPNTCGISEKARCVCDRTKLYYGINDHGTVTSCTKKKTGDLCDRPGIQLNQRGECEPCPAGTEKTTNDTSLCKNKTESRIFTTIGYGTGYQPPITTPNPGGNMSQSSPEEDSIGAFGIVGIIVGVAVVLAVVIVVMFVYKKRTRRRHSQDKEKNRSNNNISSDDSSGNSHGNSEQSLLMKPSPLSDLIKFDGKPVMMVGPTISVDESKDCEDEDTHFSIDDEVMHQGIPFIAGDNEETIEPSIPLETVGPDNSITGVKAEYSADETNLKVPVASVRGRPVDMNNTAVKASYSGETEVKQVVVGPSDGRFRRVGAIPLAEETFLKQVERGNSRVVCQSDNTLVKPFVISGDTAVKQEGHDSSKKNSEVKIGSVKPSVSLEETNPKRYDSLDTNRTVPVSPSTPEQFTNQRTADEHYQVHDTNFPEMLNGEKYSSPPIQGQPRTYNSSQQNSIQPSVCHTKADSIQPSVCHTKAESKALNTERVCPSVDTRQWSQNNTSVAAKELVSPQTQDSIRNSDKVLSSNKILGQKNCGYLEDSNTMPGVSSVRAALHREPERSGSHDDTGGAEGVENLTPRTCSGVMTPRVTPTCRPQRVEPVRASQTSTVQNSLQCTVGAVGQVNSEGYDQKEDLNPLHRQISGQNSSGSMCQNSTVENSTASSGYGTARKSEMESSAKNYYPLRVQRIPSEVGSPEPMVINPLLRSESHEANDSHQPVTYNKSLGLGGLMAAPSLRPDSSDSVSGIAEHRDMPVVIKTEQIPMPARFEESNRHQVIPNHQIDPVTVESGYCS